MCWSHPSGKWASIKGGSATDGCACGWSSSRAAHVQAERVAEVHAVRDIIHSLSTADVVRRFAVLKLQRRTPPPARQHEIDHYLCGDV
jgi:hypothetical protein